MARRALLGSWISRSLASLSAVAICGGALHAGPPLNDHARERAVMASKLGFVSDYDEPPKPVRLSKPLYPKRAREECLEGTVVVLIGIDAKGSVSAAKVVESRDGHSVSSVTYAPRVEVGAVEQADQADMRR